MCKYKLVHFRIIQYLGQNFRVRFYNENSHLLLFHKFYLFQ